MDDAHEKFVEVANPHAWWLAGGNLHAQALHLYGRRGTGSTTLLAAEGTRAEWDDTNKSVFLLGGFALENIIKAFLVYEHPEWISNGKLARPLRTHKLTDLQARSTLIPRQKRDEEVLRRFEEGLESWARYPCGLSFEASASERALQPMLWKKYVRLFGRYDRALRTKLKKLWTGPHGWAGKYTISGEWT